MIRTSLPFWRSRPRRALVGSALAGLVAAMTLPFGPWAGVLGFSSPPLAILAGITALILIYLVAAELLKGFALQSPASKQPRMPTNAAV